jgi:hypothetical protein
VKRARQRVRLRDLRPQGHRHDIDASTCSSNDLGLSLRGPHQDFRTRRSRQHQRVTRFAAFDKCIDGCLMKRVPSVVVSNDNAGIQNR